jgi:steroid delta-isomerase-like uncharacterized protein
MSCLEKNKALVTRYFEEVWNQGKLEVLDEIIDADYVNHSPGIPNPPRGPAGLKPIVYAMRQAFPDLKYVVENLVISEEQVAAHVTMHGTHLGDFFGLAPTGKTIKVAQMQIEQIKNGKIIAHWRVTDDLTLMRQLGQIAQ